MADNGLWLALLGISGGDKLRLEMDGTRAGRLTWRPVDGWVGGLSTPGSADLDIFAFTRTFTADLGAADTDDDVSSVCMESAERAGDEAVLISAFGDDESICDDVLPLRDRTNDGGSAGAAVSARCRYSGSGDVEFAPFVLAVKRALTAAPAGEAFGVRVCVGLKGEGARVGIPLLRLLGGGETTLGALRAFMLALLLTLAFGRTSGGDRDVAGGLKGDAGRLLS